MTSADDDLRRLRTAPRLDPDRHLGGRAEEESGLAWLAKQGLQQADDLDFERDGVRVFRNVLPLDLVEEARKTAYELHESCGGRFTEHGSFALDGQYATSCHVLPRFGSVRALITHLPLRTVVPQGRMAVVHSKFSYKTVGGPHQWAPHQDAAYKPETRSGFVFGIPLEPCNESNGTLEVFPGFLDLQPHGRRSDDQLVMIPSPTTPAVPVPMEPGDVVAFSLYTAHQSGLNTSHGLRAILFIELEPFRSNLRDDIGGLPVVVE